MAVMTIPSLMQNSNSQQRIVMFKKGFNAAVNAYTTEYHYEEMGLVPTQKLFETPTDNFGNYWIVTEDDFSITKPILYKAIFMLHYNGNGLYCHYQYDVT